MLESDNHDLLMEAMINYVDARTKHHFRRGRNSGYAAKRWLREVRRLSRIIIREFIDEYAEQKQNKGKNLRKGDSKLPEQDI